MLSQLWPIYHFWCTNGSSHQEEFKFFTKCFKNFVHNHYLILTNHDWDYVIMLHSNTILMILMQLRNESLLAFKRNWLKLRGITEVKVRILASPSFSSFFSQRHKYCLKLTSRSVLSSIKSRRRESGAPKVNFNFGEYLFGRRFEI